jgi:EVE domain
MARVGNSEGGADVRARQFWIVVVARDAAVAGASEGYLQLGSGKAGPLERMQGGDGFVLYSPRTSADGAALQAFTAIGRVRDAPIEIVGGPGGRFRRAAEFMPAGTAPIRPLLPALSFIRNKVQWGAAFRFGVVRVPEDDFARIAQAMGRAAEIDFPAGVAQFDVTA